MITLICSVLHFLVDMVCAWAMFRFFRQGSDGYLNLLVYNFCAFAMQMPLGTLLDLVKRGRRNITLFWTLGGMLLTAAGAMIHPAVLGLGNALFHVGAGIDVIESDRERRRGGRDLGLFVAPGALGLYLGTCLGKGSSGTGVLLSAAVLMVLLGTVLINQLRERSFCSDESITELKACDMVLIACCFLVVILRSWVGMGVTFPWKAEYGVPAVLAVALGKVLGGYAAARFGVRRTILWSLILAAVCFLLGNNPVFGIGALLLFNMSMPVTLYLLAERLKGLAGFSFGLLTFGLFLGFLPVYYGIELSPSAEIFGAAGSVLSCLILLAAGKAVRPNGISI